MDTLALDVLAGVLGAADNTTRVQVGPFAWQRERSNYQVCATSVARMTRSQYPDSRPWYQFWGTDGNAAARERARVSETLANCGKP